jgi:phosphoserine phosphatase RsbU/P
MIKKIDNIRNCKILIIEDNNVARAVLKEIFSKNGFKNIEEAENGKKGLEKTYSFRPDLIILDVVMPEMNGEECCKQIRQDNDPHIANVPILFQTSLDGALDKSRLFAAGATDYISKPVDQKELIARATVHLEREIMTNELREFNLRVMHELSTARDSQMVLIPDEISIKEMEKDYGLQIHGHYQPCSELGGDFWGFKSLSSEELAIYMVDFSGHGVNAALNVFRLHTLMQSAMDIANSPGVYLSYLNTILSPLLPVGQFATMFYGVINSKRKILSYASAAAPTPILFKHHGASHQLLETKGFLLGISKDSNYQTIEVPFSSSDCLLLYSDALTETPDKNGKMLTIEETLEIFESKLTTDYQPSYESFKSLLEHFNNNHLQYIKDDLTLNTYYSGYKN